MTGKKGWGSTVAGWFIEREEGAGRGPGAEMSAEEAEALINGASGAAAASSPEATASRNRVATSLFSSAVVAGHSAAAGVASCAAERGGPGSTSEPRSVETRVKTRSADCRMDHPSYGNEETRGSSALQPQAS